MRRVERKEVDWRAMEELHVNLMYIIEEQLCGWFVDRPRSSSRLRELRPFGVAF